MGFLRKYIFPILFGVIFFSLFKNHLPKFKVLSALETIDLLKKNDKLSLVRFGDGEFDIIAQKRGPNYQRTSPRLREALLKILNSRSICVAVPEALSVDVLTPENSTNSHLRFWRTYVVLRAQLFRHILDSTRLYGDACVSRPYTNSQDDQLATQVFRQIRTLWANKNVVVIEGELTVSESETIFSTTQPASKESSALPKTPSKNAISSSKKPANSPRIQSSSLHSVPQPKSSPTNSPTSSKPLIWGIWTLNTNGI